MSKLKKIWIFLKTHWYVPLILIGMVVTGVLFFDKKKDKLAEMFDAVRDKYEKEIDIIEDNERLKEEEKKKAKEQYDKALLELEKKIKLKKEEISKVQKKKVKELIKKHGDDYDSMVREMAEEFDFKIV